MCTTLGVLIVGEAAGEGGRGVAFGVRGGRGEVGDGGDGGGERKWIIQQNILPAACNVQICSIYCKSRHYGVEGRKIDISWRGTEADESKMQGYVL